MINSLESAGNQITEAHDSMTLDPVKHQLHLARLHIDNAVQLLKYPEKPLFGWTDNAGWAADDGSDPDD